MAIPPTPPEQPELIPVLLMNSHWWCLDCPEKWDSRTDYSALARGHFERTGHRVNGIGEHWLRMQPLPEVTRC